MDNRSIPRSFIFAHHCALELDPRVGHLDQLTEFIDVLVAIPIEIDVSRYVKRQLDRFVLRCYLGCKAAIATWPSRRGLRRKIDLVAVEVVVAIDQNGGLRCGDHTSKIGLGKVGKTQVLGTLDVNPLITKRGSCIENDHVGLFAHLEELIQAQDPRAAMGFDLGNQFLEVFVADSGLGVFTHASLPW